MDPKPPKPKWQDVVRNALKVAGDVLKIAYYLWRFSEEGEE
jgi:hypothetical protein